MAARRAAVALPIPLPPPVTSETFGVDSAGNSMPAIQNSPNKICSACVDERIEAAGTAASCPLHFDLGGLDHRLPLRKFCGDECLEVFRSASDALQGVLLHE